MAALQGQGKADFTAAERAAITYAESLTRNAVPDGVFAELRRHWSDRAIVEITAVACAFNFTNRFNTALDTDVTAYPKGLG